MNPVTILTALELVSVISGALCEIFKRNLRG